MSRFSMAALAAIACAGVILSAGPVRAQAAGTAQGRVIGITFVGRLVSNLDRSVAFYEALGFHVDPKASPVWRRDPVTNGIYGIRGSGARSRMAKLYIDEVGWGQRFVLYLREFKGIPRRNLSHHTAWEPGASHFGLVVPHADRLWSHLAAEGLLHARSWGGRLIAPPGQTQGLVAYVTDPDGLDIEMIRERPAVAAANGRPASPALRPGVNHVGLVVLDSAKERAFYGGVLGGRLVTARAPWLRGDFYDAAVGGHGNILRFYNESFPFAPEYFSGAPTHRIHFEMVEFKNRKKPVRRSSITDIGVGYVGMAVDDLGAVLRRAQAAGAQLVSDGIVTMRGSGTRVAMIRDPDVGGFIELYEHPKH
jgi:catechol 2,3-dioxygenase-like lactoylglutathione lyase family enzyme